MKLWVVIILYKTPKQQLNLLLEQLKQASIKKAQIFLKDNTHDNIGYAKAVNIGLKIGLKQNYTHFCLLNPDIRLIRFNFEEINDGFKKFDIFGGVFKQGQKTYYRGVIDPVYLSGGLDDKKPTKVIYPTDFVSGSMLFVNLRAIKTMGLFDEDYFLYYEDADYCYRAKKAKLRLGINSKIKYEHFEDSQHNPQKQQYLATSHQLFVRKQGQLWQKIIFWFKKKYDR